MRKPILVFLLLATATIALLVFNSLKFFDGKLHVVFCDVGQGDAVFIRTSKNFDVLIDGGPDNKVIDCLQSHMPLWDRKIDYVFLTHPDADHLTGLIKVVKSYRIEQFVTQNRTQNNSLINKELKKHLVEKRIAVKNFSEGQDVVFPDQTIIKTLWPDKGNTNLIVKDKPNSGALIQKISFKAFDLLTTSDVDSDILNHLDDIYGVDILKVPHHGSKYGMDNLTLLNLNPLYAVISVGKNNYGHPADNVLSLLSGKNIKVFRTDEKGDVEFATDGVSLEVYTQK